MGVPAESSEGFVTPLTPAERGRLGGLTAAHNLGPEGIKRRGSKGGQATLEKLGKAHFLRMALIQQGRLKKGGPITER